MISYCATALTEQIVQTKHNLERRQNLNGRLR